MLTRCLSTSTSNSWSGILPSFASAASQKQTKLAAKSCLQNVQHFLNAIMPIKLANKTQPHPQPPQHSNQSGPLGRPPARPNCSARRSRVALQGSGGWRWCCCCCSCSCCCCCCCCCCWFCCFCSIAWKQGEMKKQHVLVVSTWIPV